MLEVTAFLAAIGPVAILITKVVDFVRSFDTGNTWPKGLWIALALVGGVAYALLTGLNWINLIDGLNPGVSAKLTGTPGQIATGLAIGAMACFWHEPLSGWGTKAGPTDVSTK